jgi:hypothetical protein
VLLGLVCCAGVKVGRREGQCMQGFWSPPHRVEGSVIEATLVRCHVDYTDIEKVPGYTRRRVRHVRKNVSSWAAASTESSHKALKRAAQGGGIELR